MKTNKKAKNSYSNLKNSKKNSNEFLTKKKVILTSLATLMIASPISIGLSQVSFGQKKTSNLESLNQKFQNGIETINKRVEGNDTKWKLSYNNTTKTFNSPEELRKFMYDNFLQTKEVKTNLDLNSLQNELGQLNVDDEFLKNVSENVVKEDTKTVYKGYGDVAYDTEDKAKESYFQVKDGYNYNGIYFKSKTDLNNYLLANPQTTSSINSIVIEGPNGVKSAPININDPRAANDIKSFINNNASKVVSYTSSNGETIDINKDNIDTAINKVNLKDTEYIHMYSNEGQSRYVVDNSIYDNNNLIGPYFYNGVLDVGSFMNKSMWKKTTGVKKQAFLSSKVDEMIGQFFTNIINDDNVLNLVESKQENKVPPLFRTLLYLDENNNVVRDSKEEENKKKISLDDWFMARLAQLSPGLAAEVVQTNRTLLTGKKYNTFFKIPIMYSFIMQRIVSYNLGTEILNLTIDYFTAVANFIQDAIDIVTLDNKDLLTRDKDKKVFDVKEFFKIGDPEYNLNTSTEYFLNEIKSYSKLVGAMSTFMGASNNITLTAGLMPFDSYNQEFLFDFGIISRDAFYGRKSTYEAIYNSFSALDYQTMLTSFVKNNQNSQIKQFANTDQKDWAQKLEAVRSTRTGIDYSTVLKGIGMKNTEYHDLARGLINTEIRLFNASGELLTDGYLTKLLNADPKKDRLKKYVEFMNNNPKLDAYRVYLAMVADIRTSGRFFVDENSTANLDAYMRTITRLVGFAFGSAYMAGSAIKTMYNNFKRKPSGSMQTGTWENNWVNEPIYDIPDGVQLTGWKEASISPVPSATLHPLYEYFKKRGIEYAGGDGTISGGSIGSIGQWGGSIWGDINKDKNSSFASTTASLRGSVSGAGSSNVNPENQAFPVSKYKTIYAEIKRPANSPQIDGTINRIDRTFKFLDKYDTIDGNYSIKYASLRGIGDVRDGISSPIYQNVGSRRGSVQSLVSPFEDAISISGMSWNTIWDDTSTTAPSVNGSANNTAKRKWNASQIFKWSGKTALSKVKNFANLAANVLAPVISTALFGMEIFFLVADFIKEEYTQEFYVYTTADGTEFIWDGGLTVSKYLGFEVKQLNNIDSMKLVKPIQITLPQVEEYYYFNGNKFYDTNSLKRSQLKYILESGNIPTSERFKIKFTLSNVNNNYSANSLNELVEEVFKDMNITKKSDGSYDFSKFNSNSKYISKSGFAFSNGVIVDNTHTAAVITKNIIDNIRATKIVKVVKDTNSQTSNNEFVYPGKYWDGTKVIENKTPTTEYLIDNSANELKNKASVNNKLLSATDYVEQDILKAEKASHDKLLATFKSKTNVQSKKTTISQSNSTNKYSDLLGEATKQNLYVVNLPGRAPMYFSDITKAQTVISNALGIKKEATYTNKVYYQYKGIIFESIDEIIHWANERKFL